MTDGPWPVVVALVGPTATGKSHVAIALAGLLGGEVVNADAFQVYRGMDIGTAKVPEPERGGIAHHLLDFLDVTDELSVADFQARGRAVLRDLAAHGTPAVVAGGSGLYVRALLDDLRFPGSDPAIRAHWERRLEQVGPQDLHRTLAERDPEAAAQILPSNGRRIVRALEVGEITGGGFIAHLPANGPALIPHASIGLDVPRPTLDERIAVRVEGMFAAGLVEEVRGLLARGLEHSPTARKALGYPQVIDLIRGRTSAEQARHEVVVATRRFARRQERWFRRDPRTRWVVPGPDALSTARAILDLTGELPRTLGT